MSITAKYPGTCTKCSKPIVPGQAIEWRKGAGSHHVDCSTASKAPAPAAAGKCGKCGRSCKPQYRTCFACSGKTSTREMCADCGEYPGVIDCRDSSGIVAKCCRRCASMSPYERSFA